MVDSQYGRYEKIDHYLYLMEWKSATWKGAIMVLYLKESLA